MEGFTKSNFPPRSWEGNYELLKGSTSFHPVRLVLSFFIKRFHFSSTQFIFLHSENGLRPSHLVTALGARSSWNNSPRCYFRNSLLPGRYPTLIGLPTLTLRVAVISLSVFFLFWGIFTTWRQGKRLANPTKGVLRFRNKIAISWPKEVARFRQCVSVGRQNWVGFLKISTIPSRQSSFTAN